ncbi:MAG: DNA polymerase/3'-5' exonuclease PolX [Thermoplasmatales archaeon]|nr:MAG: DNA polymerase/3'-5' exonuclease PolX [Thermoplasmatales archaeon]
MKNQLVAEIFYQIAALLEILGEIPFKSRAYRKAAQVIETLDENIENIAKEDKLRSLPGVGEGLAKKIKEIVETGGLEYFEKLKKEIPGSLATLISIPGVGPKKASVLYKTLGISTVQQLKEACEKGKLRDLDGFGEITERNIIRGIKMLEKASGRVLLSLAYEDGNKYLEYLRKMGEIVDVNLAGSLRRMKETIGDLDILASSNSPDEVMDYFVNYSDVKNVLLKGSTKTSVVLDDDIQVDLRVVKPESYGAALQYFTGSKEHNVKLRGIAIRKGLKLSEYGVFEKKTDKYVVGRSEEEVYNALDLPLIEPELRENRGEIEAGRNKRLPRLIGYDDVKGDFHVHSMWSDGSDSIEDIAFFAKKQGFSFLGIADHSQSLKVAFGLSEEKIDEKLKEIEKINEKLSGFRVFSGTECDIRADGSLDYNDKILKQFDIVCAAVHSRFNMNKEEMTKRVLRAMENEHVNILAHPTCRLIGIREPVQLDMEMVIDASRDTGTFLEINAFPDRLDLNDILLRVAKERNANFVIGTDAHSIDHLRYIRFGIATARRGWLEKKDVLNTYSIKEIEKRLHN